MRVQAYLEGETIISTVETFQGKPMFHVRKADGEKYKLIENLVDFFFQCK